MVLEAQCQESKTAGSLNLCPAGIKGSSQPLDGKCDGGLMCFESLPNNSCSAHAVDIDK